MKHKQSHVRLTGFFRAFLILALLFFALGLGTLGSVRSFGKSYRLAKQRSGDAKTPSVIIRVTEPGHGTDGHVHRTLYITDVYVNVGTVYAPYGENATLRLSKGSGIEYFYQHFDHEIVNLPAKGAENVSDPNTMLFNWEKINLDDEVWALSNSPFWELTVQGADVLINEIVFIANEADRSGEPILLEATLDQASNLPGGSKRLKDAEAVVDCQRFPDLSQSSFSRFSSGEAADLTTLAEMKQGSEYQYENIYHMDTVYNSFGLDLMAIGTSIFGFSPFGLRFMPFLAAFGTLLFGFFFVKRLFHSEKAGFGFALVYALSGLSISLGHFGSPLMIGVFFLIASLYFCLRYFQDGMKKASFFSAFPILLSAVFAAAAVCVNGACLIPALGIAAFFAVGFVRQRRLQRAALDIAIENAEREETELSESPEPGKEHLAKTYAVKLHNESRSQTILALAIFSIFFVFGFLLLSMLSSLPLYNVFIKVYDDPSAPSKSIFYFLWKAFAGGFSGFNGVEISAWNPVALLFKGAGDLYAATGAGALFALGSLLFGIFGAIYALIRLVRERENMPRSEFFCPVLLFSGFVLSIITAFFAKGALGFMFLAYLFLFAFAGYFFQESGGSEKKWVKVMNGILFAALIASFLIFAVVIFSIPLPASFMNRLFA